MNYIKHLAGFFEKISEDDRLNPTHVSLYVSLFQFWNASRFHNPISISRTEAMKVSKICSKATYHKCIRELNDFGYLSYHPSYNPFKGSLVYLFNFQSGVNNNEHLTKSETGDELVLNNSRTKNRTSSEQALNKQRTSTEQALVSYINNTNIINSINNINKREAKKANSNKTLSQKKILENEKSKKSTSDKFSESESKKKEKSSGQKEKTELRDPERSRRVESRHQRPLLLEVQTYFKQKAWPELEAEKYFNHYQSNGWLIAGKTPMADWQASATKWMLNAKSYSQSSSHALLLHDKARSLHTNQEKNFGEPL